MFARPFIYLAIGSVIVGSHSQAMAVPDNPAKNERLDIHSVTFSPKGDLCAVHLDDAVLLLELPSHKLRAKLPRRSHEEAACFSPCGKYFASAGFPHPESDTVFIWKIDGEKPQLMVKLTPAKRIDPKDITDRNDPTITHLAYSADGLRIVTVCERCNRMYIWDIANKKSVELPIPIFPDSSPKWELFSGDTIITWGTWRVNLRKITTRKIITSRVFDLEDYYAEYFASDLKTMVAWDAKGRDLEIRDISKGKSPLIQKIQTLGDQAPARVAVTSDRSLLIVIPWESVESKKEEKRVIIVPLTSKKRTELGLKENEAHFEVKLISENRLWGMSLSPDNRWLAFSGVEQQLRVWDLTDMPNTFLKDAIRVRK